MCEPEPLGEGVGPSEGARVAAVERESEPEPLGEGTLDGPREAAAERESEAVAQGEGASEGGVDARVDGLVEGEREPEAQALREREAVAQAESLSANAVALKEGEDEKVAAEQRLRHVIKSRRGLSIAPGGVGGEIIHQEGRAAMSHAWKEHQCSARGIALWEWCPRFVEDLPTPIQEIHWH